MEAGNPCVESAVNVLFSTNLNVQSEAAVGQPGVE
jgi:hypothetical protein